MAKKIGQICQLGTKPNTINQLQWQGLPYMRLQGPANGKARPCQLTVPRTPIIQSLSRNLWQGLP